MDKKLRDDIFQHAKEWVLQAGETIRTKINDPLIIDTKSNPKDLVTTMDKETEYFLATNIKKTYPHHLLFSEEGYGDDVTSLDGVVWIVDPIDGTMNFVQQKRNFAISIGIFHQGIGEIGFVYDVMADILYSAKRNEGAYKNDVKLPTLKPQLLLEEAMLGFNHHWLCENSVMDERIMQQLVKKIRGSRTYGSAALKLAYVAEGIIDGYLTMNLAPWDIAGGIILVNEVGGVTTDLDGAHITLLTNESTLTCHPAVQQEIIQEYLRQGKK
ncbi:inositol monophosphatase family protein [Sporosarcina beigongshangi]|uniref:inositol monophosphatase family protein n=1 Tax=Sporosarcina beigongshangi TaxID=2782538 RepID=UPI0019394B3B|nr:inositol monophosphatase family protein [Sporosarcina beigongshangi]